MNKKMILAGAATMAILSGCQNLEDQMGAKLAESLINTATNGEVKVTIEDLEQGKMNITTKEGSISLDGTEGGGQFKITDETGKSSTFQSGEGEGRPADVPEDLPSPAGAKEFNYFNTDSLTTLNYQMPAGDLKTNCDQVQELILAAGWSEDTGSMKVESADNIIRPFIKEGYTLNQMCSLTDGVPSIALAKMKKSN